MEEIEILVEVHDSLFTVIEKIKAIAAFDKVQQVHDIYFYHPNDKLLRPFENKKLFNSLRIRRKDSAVYLTFKKDFYEADTWLYSDEYETKVESFETAKGIFEQLGFKVLVEVINKKHTFYFEEFEIVLEEVFNLGLFLEVEYIGKVKRDVNLIKLEILNFINRLGIAVSEQMNCGKPELMLKKHNKSVF